MCECMYMRARGYVMSYFILQVSPRNGVHSTGFIVLTQQELHDLICGCQVLQVFTGQRIYVGSVFIISVNSRWEVLKQNKFVTPN